MSAQTVAIRVASPQRDFDQIPLRRQGDITVGSLLLDAEIAARHAADLVDRHHSESATAAAETVKAYADVLEAMSILVGRVWGETSRMLVISDGLTGQTISSIDDFIDSLGGCGRRHPVGATESSPVAAAWRTVSRFVRLAGDVLSTVRHPRGGWRSLDAAAFDDRVACAALLGSIARLVVVIGPCAPYLRLQARAVGVAATEIDRLSPDSAGLLWSAQRLQRQLPTAAHALHALRPVSYLVDRRDLVAEVSGRVARLRRSAWLQSTQPYVDTATLHAYAMFALALHDFLADSLPVRQLAGHGTWLLTARCLVDLRTATPVNRTVVSDAAAIRRLLRQPNVVSNRETVLGLVPEVENAIVGLPDLATWNSESFAAAGHREQVYLAASSLSGAEVTDDPNLVRVKLAGGVVPAPPQRLKAVLTAYAAAAAVRQRSSSPVAVSY